MFENREQSIKNIGGPLDIFKQIVFPTRMNE